MKLTIRVSLSFVLVWSVFAGLSYASPSLIVEKAFLPIRKPSLVVFQVEQPIGQTPSLSKKSEVTPGWYVGYLDKRSNFQRINLFGNKTQSMQWKDNKLIIKQPFWASRSGIFSPLYMAMMSIVLEVKPEGGYAGSMTISSPDQEDSLFIYSKTAADTLNEKVGQNRLLIGQTDLDYIQSLVAVYHEPKGNYFFVLEKQGHNSNLADTNLARDHQEMRLGFLMLEGESLASPQELELDNSYVSGNGVFSFLFEKPLSALIKLKTDLSATVRIRAELRERPLVRLSQQDAIQFIQLASLTMRYGVVLPGPCNLKSFRKSRV